MAGIAFASHDDDGLISEQPGDVYSGAEGAIRVFAAEHDMPGQRPDEAVKVLQELIDDADFYIHERHVIRRQNDMRIIAADFLRNLHAMVHHPQRVPPRHRMRRNNDDRIALPVFAGDFADDFDAAGGALRDNHARAEAQEWRHHQTIHPFRKRFQRGLFPERKRFFHSIYQCFY